MSSLVAFVFSFPVCAQDSWVGNPSFYSTRSPQGQCSFDPQFAITDGRLDFTSWTRTRATLTNLCFEVYVKGITDQEVVRSGVIDLALYGAPSKFPARFLEKRGNNYVYVVNVRDLDPVLQGVSPSGNTQTELEIELRASPVDAGEVHFNATSAENKIQIHFFN